MNSLHLILFSRTAEATPLRSEFLSITSGGLAAVSGVASRLNIPHTLYDEMYYGSDLNFDDFILGKVEDALLNVVKVHLYAEIYIYNSDNSLILLEKAKRMFGKRIVTGVGGHLTRLCSSSYHKNGLIDVVGIGDSESILEKMLSAENGIIECNGKVNAESERVFNYSNYYALESRLDLSEKETIIGYGEKAIRGVRQLTVERASGCPWAARSLGGCSFCGIDDNQSYVSMPVSNYHKQIQFLVERYKINWLFDPSSQWLPWSKNDAFIFMKTYLREMKKNPGSDCQKYIYLSPYIIDDEICELMVQVNIGCVYLGIDHFDPDSLIRLEKPQYDMKRLKKCFDSLKAYNIKTRIGLVVGVYENQKSEQSLIDGLNLLYSNYSSILLTIGCYPISIFPGTKLFDNFSKRDDLPDDALAIIKDIHYRGAISWDKQLQLDKVFMNMTCEKGADGVLSFSESVMKLAKQNSVSSYHSKLIME